MVMNDVSIVLTPASAIRPVAVRWLWEGRLPLGMLTLLVGAPAQGKSTITIELSAQTSRGQLAGDLYGTPVPVAIATAEDVLDAVLRPRLDAAGADLDRVHLISAERDGETGLLTLPEDVPALETRCRAVGIRLLVVDPIVAHIPATADSHRDQHVRRVLGPLARLAETADLAVLGVMHLNKRQDAAEVLALINGSVAFGAAPRSVLFAGAEPGGTDTGQRMLAHGKCNVGVLAPTLRFGIETRWVAGAAGPIKTSGIVWRGEAAAISALDLVRPAQDDDEQTALAEAMDVVREIVGQGPVPVKDARSRLRDAGVAERTADRARARLGIKARPDGFQGAWRWHPLTSPVSPAPPRDDREPGDETDETNETRRDCPVSPQPSNGAGLARERETDETSPCPSAVSAVSPSSRPLGSPAGAGETAREPGDAPGRADAAPDREPGREG
jgi:hypothetical protein